MIVPVVLGAIVSFIMYRQQCTPDCGYTFNQLNIHTYTIHLHHWLISLLVLPFVSNPILRGFLIGGIVHGILMYDDWHQIIKSKE